MAFSDVSSASNYFTTAYEGFSTTANGAVSSGATTVNLNSVSGLTDGSFITLVIEPGETNEQTFTGTVDTSNTRITSVVWTRGTNVTHATGSSIVCYDTGTDHNLLSTGLQVEHDDDGTHGAITPTSITTIGNITLNGGEVKTDTVAEKTAANGVTVDGLNIKDSKLNTADSVEDDQLIYGKLRSRQGGSATDWTSPGSTTYDVSATNVYIQSGSKSIDANPTTVTFPTAFNQKPHVIASTFGAGSANAFTIVLSISTTQATFRQVDDGGNVITSEKAIWMAIGE